MTVDEVAGQLKRDFNKEIKTLISKRPLSRMELCEELHCELPAIQAALKFLRAQGANIAELIGGKLFLHSSIERGGSLTLQAKDRGDGWTAVGFVTDNHLCNTVASTF